MEDLKIKKYGFTGTRDGMNVQQKEEIIKMLQKDINDGIEIIASHGDCIGADKDFHDLLRSLSIHIKIIIHPGYSKIDIENKLRAWCENPVEYILEPKPFLKRNKNIVDTCDILIGCPRTSIEDKRSGTWATIRYSKKIGKPTIILC